MEILFAIISDCASPKRAGIEQCELADLDAAVGNASVRMQMRTVAIVTVRVELFIAGDHLT